MKPRSLSCLAVAACAALLMTGCGGGGQSAVPNGLRQTGNTGETASTGRSPSVTAKVLNYAPFSTVTASASTKASLGIKQWNFFAWQGASKTVTVIGVGSDDSVVWEGDVTPQTSGAWQLITSKGTNAVAAASGAVTPYVNKGSADSPYAQALQIDTTGSNLAGPVRPGGGGPQQMAAGRKTQSTAGLWSGITTVAAGIGGLICIAAEPCGAGAAAALLVTGTASGAFTIYDNIPNPNDFNFVNPNSPNTSVSFAPDPAGYNGGGTTQSHVCVFDDAGNVVHCYITYY